MTFLVRSALLCALCLLPAARAAQPVADYQFQNTLGSAVAGAPALVHLVDATNQQPNTFTTAQVDGIPRTVLHFPHFNGVVLRPLYDLVLPDIYTVAALFSFEEVTGYRRILDFKNGETDNGIYSYSGGLVLYPVTSSTVQTIGKDTFHQVVLSRDENGMVRGYVDGRLVLETPDAGNDHARIDRASGIRFFQDNTGGAAPVRESSAGKVARIRLYNVALSASEIAGLDRLPGVRPDQIRLLRIVAGLEAATAADVAAWDTNGDKALTMADAVARMRQ